jgi:hypothetical protein
MDMRTSKFREEQIIGFLRQAEAGMPIKELEPNQLLSASDGRAYKRTRQ